MLRTQELDFDINHHRNLRALWQGRLSFSWQHGSLDFPNFETRNIAFSNTRDMESSRTFALKISQQVGTWLKIALQTQTFVHCILAPVF